MAKTSKTDSFQLKAEFLPITTLHLLQSDMNLLQTQLENITQKAPQYFANAPIIVDFRGLTTSDPFDAKKICAILREFQMQPIAARGLNQPDVLPLLSENSEKAKQKTIENQKVEMRETSRIITKPVRAGTQIYAKDSDLIILSSVNAGAEIIADGNIHIYGPLRGRALAGARGDENARIFCKDCEAELISIAGHYWINEKIKSLNIQNKFVQFFLNNNELKLELI